MKRLIFCVSCSFAMRYVNVLYLEVIPSSLQCCLEIPVRKGALFLGIVHKASRYFHLSIKYWFVLWAQYTVFFPYIKACSYVDSMAAAHIYRVVLQGMFWGQAMTLLCSSVTYTRWDSSPCWVHSFQIFTVAFYFSIFYLLNWHLKGKCIILLNHETCSPEDVIQGR